MSEPEETKSIEQIFEEAKEIINDSLKFLPFCRDAELQEQAASKLEAHVLWVKSAKFEFVKNAEENRANQFLQLQCTLYAVASILRCILCVKQKEYDRGWKFAIDAEEYLAVARKAHHEVDLLLSLAEHRDKIESVLFPEMPFYNSMGSIVSGGLCNICGQDFDECTHLEGLVYIGRLCRRVGVTNIEYNHSALVQKPRDRRCIPLSHATDKNQWRDQFTWSIRDDKPPPDGSNINFIFFANEYIDTD